MFSERFGWKADYISEMPMNQITGYLKEIKKADEAEKKSMSKMPKVPRMKQVPRGRR